MRLPILAVGTLLLSATTLAAPGHSDDGHGHADFAAGKPGQADQVDRVVQVDATDQMRFHADDWHFQAGETVRFEVTNSGAIEHEFVLDSRAGNADHRQSMMDAMASGDGMAHQDPNAVTLAPGEQASLIWTFTETGQFEAACNIPGHYQAGMHAEVAVSAN